MHEPGSLGAARARDGDGQPAARGRAPAGLHARALRPLRPGRRRSSTAPAASCGCTPTTSTRRAPREDPEQALQRRLEVARAERRAGARRCARYADAREGSGFGIARDRRARPRRSSPGVEIETDLGTWQVDRDARPRALARLPLPGGAPHPDLRRPPARARLALLRLRLVARPGRRVPALARRGRGRSTRACAWPATARPFTDVAGAHRGQPRARRRARRERVARARSRSGPLTAFEAVPHVHGDGDHRRDANWWLSETLCYLRHLEVDGPRRARGRRGDRAAASRWCAAAEP